MLLRRERGGGGVQQTPNLIFLEVGHGKTKPGIWVDRSLKMRNLHRCHCLQKVSKYGKTTKTILSENMEMVTRFARNIYTLTKNISSIFMDRISCHTSVWSLLLLSKNIHVLENSRLN